MSGRLTCLVLSEPDTPAYIVTMIDKTQEIKEFIQKNFSPGSPDDHTFYKTSSQILSMLFSVFPLDCVDTYDIYEILSSLDYSPVKLENEIKLEKDIKEKIVGFYWCLKIKN